jgi:hypothetical protein
VNKTVVLVVICDQNFVRRNISELHDREGYRTLSWLYDIRLRIEDIKTVNDVVAAFT